MISCIQNKILFIINNLMNTSRSHVQMSSNNNQRDIYSRVNKSRPAFDSRMVAQFDEEEKKRSNSMRESVKSTIQQEHIQYPASYGVSQKKNQYTISEPIHLDYYGIRDKNQKYPQNGNQAKAQFQKIAELLNKKSGVQFTPQHLQLLLMQLSQSMPNNSLSQQPKAKKPKIMGENIIKSYLVDGEVQKEQIVEDKMKQSIPFWQREEAPDLPHFVPATFSSDSQPQKKVIPESKPAIYQSDPEQQLQVKNTLVMKPSDSRVINQVQQVGGNKSKFKKSNEKPYTNVQKEYIYQQTPYDRSQRGSNKTDSRSKPKNQPEPKIRQVQLDNYQQNLVSLDAIPQLNLQIKKNVKQEPQKVGSTIEKKVPFVQVAPRMRVGYQPKASKSFNKISNTEELSERSNKQSQGRKTKRRQFNDNTSGLQGGTEQQKKYINKSNRAIINKANSIQSAKISMEQDQKFRKKLTDQSKKQEKFQQAHQSTFLEDKIMGKKIYATERVDRYNSTDQYDNHKQIPKRQRIDYLEKQLNRLKRKVKQNQKLNHKPIDREQKVYKKPVNPEKKANRQNKSISVNYKDYNIPSLGRPMSKKNIALDKLQSSSSKNISDDNFNQLQQFMHIFQHPPSTKDTPEQLIQLFAAALQRFGVNIDDYSSINLSRFQQNVQLELKNGPSIIWSYEGSLYFGDAVKKRGGRTLEKEGEGIQILNNKHVYKGAFSKNKKNGFGIFINSQRDRYKGYWKNQCFEGRGQLLTQSSQYDGFFIAGIKHVTGLQIFSNGDSYDGNYENGKFHGKGKYIWKNRTIYQGDFKNGYMDGEGVWTQQEGDTYEGHYFKNMKHGYGIYRWSDGKVYEGRFQYGQLMLHKTGNTATTIDVQKPIRYEINSQDEDQLRSLKMQSSPPGKRKIFINSYDQLSQDINYSRTPSELIKK